MSQAIAVLLRARPLSAGLALLVLAACGGSSTPNTPTTTPTPTVSAASIAVSISAVSAGAGSISGFAYETSFTLRLAESAGLGANINFIRMEVYSPGGTLLERVEVGANNFGGNNRLNAMQTRDLAVRIGFNAQPETGRYVLISVGLTDDRGNNSTLVSSRYTFQ